LHDKRIAVLDYGCTRAFDVDFLEKLRAVSRATHRDDRDALHAALVGIGFVREGDRYDFETARRFVRGYHGPMLHDRTGPIDLGEAMTMKEVTKQKMELLKLTLPGELLFLFRIRFGLMSVLARIGSRANWHRLELAAIGD
jgi:predicted unusual protein kinase regulating ubiquinone biosynthesis (AarF/ABC1/UbiB family)